GLRRAAARDPYQEFVAAVHVRSELPRAGGRRGPVRAGAAGDAHSPPRPGGGGGRMSKGPPLIEIFRQPRLIVAVVCGVASYSMMNLVMTSAPVAMLDCNHSVTDAALGLQWHVLAMFAPSLFTGTLITRFGTDRVAGCGLAIIAAGALPAL